MLKLDVKSLISINLLLINHKKSKSSLIFFENFGGLYQI